MTTTTIGTFAQQCLDALHEMGGYRSLDDIARWVNSSAGRSVQGRHVAQALGRLPEGTVLEDGEGGYAAAAAAAAAPPAAAEGAAASDNPLLDLSIDDLRARYAEVFGEPTRSTNRRYLLHRLGEALRERGDIPPATASDLSGLTTEELQARYAEVFGRPTKSTDRRYLAWRINQGRRGIGVELKRAASPRLGMSADDLRAEYERVVGRATTSTNRRYLLWKIAQAEQGKVATGPVGRSYDEFTVFKTIPFRLPTEHADTLDAAWKVLGYVSRMDFLRAALREKLESSAVRIDGMTALIDELTPQA